MKVKFTFLTMILTWHNNNRIPMPGKYLFLWWMETEDPTHHSLRLLGRVLILEGFSILIEAHCCKNVKKNWKYVSLRKSEVLYVRYVDPKILKKIIIIITAKKMKLYFVALFTRLMDHVCIFGRGLELACNEGLRRGISLKRDLKRRSA